MIPSLFPIELKALTTSFNFRLISTLVVASAALLTLHRLGAMDIERDLFGNIDTLGYYTFGDNQTALSVSESEEGAYELSCQRDKPGATSFCGIAFPTAQGWPANGVDLSRYHSVELKIDVIAKTENPRIKVSFRNFDPAYSYLGDRLALKFNSISYMPSRHADTLVVPLNSFHVETWWVRQKNVGFEHSHLDFSNISIFEVIADNVTYPAGQVFVVHKAKMLGEIISEKTLIWILLSVLSITVCTLIAMQHYKLRVVSITDPLTGLINRRGLQDWVGSMTAYTLNCSQFTMFYFDIDDFKKVNDSYGHLIGDELLIAFSNMIKRSIKTLKLCRNPHAFSRLAGDEFALVFRDISESQIIEIANEIIFASNTPVNLSNGPQDLKFSFGVASTDNIAKSFDTLLSKADSAMYRAKKDGKHSFKIFDSEVQQDILLNKSIAEELAKSLIKEEFHLVFMPICDSFSLKIIGCETLLRCGNPNLTCIGPDKFIPIAEQYDLIDKIDIWVIEQAFQAIEDFKQIDAMNGLMYSINISAIQLKNTKLVNIVKRLIKKYSINTRLIEFEITETSLVKADYDTIATLQQLKDIGISISLDDFGTGYTSFSQLLSYPVDCLKIDRTFTNKISTHHNSDVVMVNATLSIANAYKLNTTAEGVEHEYQLEYLRQNNCDKVQGYYLSKPLMQNDFITYCEANR